MDNQEIAKTMENILKLFNEALESRKIMTAQDAIEIIRDRIVDLNSCNKDDDCHSFIPILHTVIADIEYYMNEGK